MIYAYRLVWILFAPFFALSFIRRIFKNKEDTGRMAERFGKASTPRPTSGKIVWMHCASLGESLCIQPLIKKLLASDDTLNILVTTGTVTSAKLMEKLLPKRAIHQFIPLDFYLFMKRFLNHWQPDISILVESEFWPELLAQAPNLILINARMSDRSAPRYAKLSKILKPLLSRIKIAYAQSDMDAQRLETAGVTPTQTTGNLKYDAPVNVTDTETLTQMQNILGDRPVLTLASTHPTEEVTLLPVYHEIKAEIPQLCLIIAPRHPHRGEAILNEMNRSDPSANIVLRGQNKELPAENTDIYIANTIGEMPIWYTLSTAVIIGGSFVKHGGQNPYEPLKSGKVTFCGPHMFNFKPIMETFKEREIILQADDEKVIAKDILYFIKNENERKKAEHDILNRMNDLGGATNKTAQHIFDHLS